MSSVISTFAHNKDTKNPIDTTIEDFLQDVQNGRWQDRIFELRKQPKGEKGTLERTEYDRIKDALPNVTVGGKFSRRHDTGLVEHSGFIAIDIDKLGSQTDRLKTLLSQDAYFYALFVSCGGNGLCGIVKIDKDKHKISYKQISEYLIKTYGVEVRADKGCNDISRIRYVSYDPDLYFNAASNHFKAKKQTPGPKIEKRDYLIIPEDFERITSEIEERKIDVTTDYERWMVLGFSIATSFEEEGRDYFHRLSQFNDTYDYDDCDKKYDNFLETKSGTLNVCWFYDHVKKHYNIKPYSDRTEAILRAAQAVYEFGAGEGVEGVKELLRTKDNFTDEQILSAEPWIAQAIKKRIPIGGDSLIADVESFLYRRFDIKKNTLIQQVEIDGKKLDQTKLNTLYVDIAKIYPKVTQQMIRAVVNTENTPAYNPFTDLINKYLLDPPPNPRGHIDRLINTIITDTPNAAYFIKKWMVAMVPSAYGEHSVLILVLCGIINSGKTEWFRRYLPPVLKQYRADNSLDHGNDSDTLMSKKLLILDDEMGGKSKMEEKQLKNRSSKQEMDLRKPYDAEETTLHRIAMLCGTSNDMEMLNDPTGNRRLICVNVQDVDKDLYNSIDKELVLFECYLEWKAGFNPRLTNADIKLLEDSSHAFKASNFTDEMFEKYFALPGTAAGEEAEMSNTEICIYLTAVGSTSAGRIDSKRLSKLLKNQGFEKGRSNKARHWKVLIIDQAEEEKIVKQTEDIL
jgi:predicted P-loop ATPase